MPLRKILPWTLKLATRGGAWLALTPDERSTGPGGKWVAQTSLPSIPMYRKRPRSTR